MTFLHLFIILLTILEENLGISTTPKELASGACMVIHKPKPWKLGRTDIKDLPINWSGDIHIISLILLAVINLIRPFLTSPIRSGMLWLVDRARDAAWAIRGSRAHS